MNTEIQLLPTAVQPDDKMNDDGQSHISLLEPSQCHQCCDDGKVSDPMTTSTQQVETIVNPLHSYRQRILRRNSMQNLNRFHRSKLVRISRPAFHRKCYSLKANLTLCHFFHVDSVLLVFQKVLRPFCIIRLISYQMQKRLS